MSAELEKAIDEIPANGQWWKRSSRASFLKAARLMIDKGVPEDLALSILEDVYMACGDEYGN